MILLYHLILCAMVIGRILHLCSSGILDSNFFSIYMFNITVILTPKMCLDKSVFGALEVSKN